MLKYKNYVGLVEYDSEGKVFTGEVIGIRSVITFQGRTPEELESSFRQSIAMYLEMCREDGVSPEKPYSGHFSIRISPHLHQGIAMSAKVKHQSINDWAIDAFEKALRTDA